ncbi:MAG: M1 family peptidase, partial [Bacteroidota bacterium]
MHPSRLLTIIVCLTLPGIALTQAGYWQQHVEYQMDIDFDVTTNQYAGQQRLVYTNNSPDTLHKVFYHLYFNAFQPGSMMDVRNLYLA